MSLMVRDGPGTYPPWKGSEWHGAGKASMNPIAISKRVVVDRLEHVDSPLREIRPLPIENQRGFFADRRNIWAAEPCLRRSLEALFDIGRHVLAKGFGSGVSESKEIAVRLQEKAVFSEAEANLLMVLAGYRNRLVHFYHEVFAEELFEICVNQLGDMGLIQNDYRRRMKEHSEKPDSQLNPPGLIPPAPQPSLFLSPLRIPQKKSVNSIFKSDPNFHTSKKRKDLPNPGSLLFSFQEGSSFSIITFIMKGFIPGLPK